MKLVRSSCSGTKKVKTCTFSPQVNIKNKREPIQTQEDVNAAHSEAKIQDLIEDLKNVIYTKVKAVATSESFGYDEAEVNDYFFVDVTPTEIGEDHHEAIRVEVRGEVSYEGLEDLMEALNPIIESYDSYAYFEPVEPGIIEAYVSVDQVDMSVYGGSEYADSSIEDSSDDSIMFEGNNYEYVTNNDGYWIYRAVIDGKGVWRAMKQGSDESQFSKLSFPISYEQARGFDAIEEPSSIARLRKDLGKMLLPNASTSVHSAQDLSMYSKQFHDAYTSAYIDFKENYPQVEVSEIYDDPSSDDNEICIQICDPSSGNCGKFYLNTEDGFVDSDYILRSFEETAEAIGIEQYPDNIESSEPVEGDAFSQLEDAYLSPPEYDDPIEHEDSEELVEVELNQIITVDADGDYEWDDDTYVWASPDGSNEEWRSEDGVYIDDKVGVVEHIDDLIIPNVPTRPGRYRVTGLAKLVYDVSGIQEYRTEYGPDDYDSDIDIDHAVVAFNFRRSEVENLKITPVRR